MEQAEALKFAEQEPGYAGADAVNILIVDDLPEKHLVYRTILDELGQNLYFARSGEEALKQVLQHEFAVILLDVNMPGMDGFETASFIRGRKRSARTPIIFLTAFTDEMHAAQGYASGAVDYLPTPVVPAVLTAKVRVFIELSQMRQQAAKRAEESARRSAAEDSARRSEFLATVTEALALSRSPEDMLSAVVHLPIPYLADASFIWLSDDDGANGRMEWATQDRDHGSGTFSPLKALPWLEELVSGVFSTGQSRVLHDVPAFDAGDKLPFPSGWSRLRHVLAVPLAIQNKPRGALIFAREAAGNYHPADMTLANILANRASVALENAMLIERIQEADLRKDEFLATLAHELRNPLAPIGNALQILRMTHAADKTVSQVTDVMQRQVEHMNRLVDDLLDISRITRGKIELKKERVTLTAVIDSAVETSRPLIEGAGHTLTVKLPKNEVCLKGDITRLSQVFSNILNNAAKYTPPKGTIRLTAEVEGGHVSVTIADSGIGIPASMLVKIFDMFTQVDTSIERAHGGLGIGLKLVKELCEMHGGSVKAKSKGNGAGSAFIVTLPVFAGETQQAKADAPAKEKADRFRILVVDDNEASGKTLAWGMEMFGHDVCLAHDGQTALVTGRTFKPQVVLLDIGLPGMNGYDLCRKMRSEAAFRDAVFIAQTGWGQKEHLLRSKEAGFSHHLTKPINMKELQLLIQQLDTKRPK